MAAYVLTAGCVLGASACTGTAQPQDKSSAPAPTASAADNRPAAALQIPALPPAEPGLSTLATVPLRRGGSTVATISAKQGQVIVTMLCTGGTLVVHMEPIATSTVSCATGAVTPVRNVHNLDAAKDAVSIRVEAGESVQWNLRVEQ